MPRKTQIPWIKWCKGLVHRREVLAMTEMIRNVFVTVERDNHVPMCARCVTPAVVAAWCMMVWEWADDNTPDGRVDGVSVAWIDKLVGCDGFAEAMVAVGWLSQTASGIEFPNWNSHNSTSAKRRAQGQRRTQLSRERPESCNDSVTVERYKNVTREEKRREDKKEERVPTVLLSADADESTNDDRLGPTRGELQSAWNRIVVKGVRCQSMNGKRGVSLKTRNRDSHFREHWSEAMHKVAASPFCSGENDRGWVATIDWFLRPDTVIKLIEGFYDGRERKHGPGSNLPSDLGRIRTPGRYANVRTIRSAEEADGLFGHAINPPGDP